MRYDEASITNSSAAIGRSWFAWLYASVYVPDTPPPWGHTLMQWYLNMRSFLWIENTYELPDYATTTQYGLEQVYFCKPLAERLITNPLMTFGSYVLVNNTSLWYRDQLVASYSDVELSWFVASQDIPGLLSYGTSVWYEWRLLSGFDMSTHRVIARSPTTNLIMKFGDKDSQYSYTGLKIQ